MPGRSHQGGYQAAAGGPARTSEPPALPGAAGGVELTPAWGEVTPSVVPVVVAWSVGAVGWLVDECEVAPVTDRPPRDSPRAAAAAVVTLTPRRLRLLTEGNGSL